MVIRDFIGRELKEGDLVVVDMPHVVAQIKKVDSGEIALATTGNAQGQVFPHIKLEIKIDTVMTPDPMGMILGVVKVGTQLSN